MRIPAFSVCLVVTVASLGGCSYDADKLLVGKVHDAAAGGAPSPDGSGSVERGAGGGSGGAATDGPGTVTGVGGTVGDAPIAGSGGTTVVSSGGIALDVPMAGAGGAIGTGGMNGGTGGVVINSVCGNGKLEGTESCDDGNTVPFDGCSSDCRREPSCKAGAGCSSQCGDGIVLGEGCDDGNTTDGDGCSSKCQVEAGWTCSQPPIGDTMKVPVIYRDFKFSKDVTGGNDFQNDVMGSYKPTTGMVNASLDAKGKPVLSSAAPATAHVASATSFATWYTNVSGTNHATASNLTLYSDGKGNYVNRYGANGEQWNITTTAYVCGTVADALLDADGKPIPCTWKYMRQSEDGGTTGSPTDCQMMEDKGYTQLPGSCHSVNGTYRALYITSKVDGNPLFFPVDKDTFSPASELCGAQISPYYGSATAWTYDLDASGNKVMHNFSFTSEVRYWFRYEKGRAYSLNFVGNDDLWVFVGGKLALDLGGIHTPVTGTLSLESDGNGTTIVTATDGESVTPTKSGVSLGLQDGVVYEVAVFSAQRQTTTAAFEVTFPPFSMAPSSCSRQ